MIWQRCKAFSKNLILINISEILAVLDLIIYTLSYRNFVINSNISLEQREGYIPIVMLLSVDVTAECFASKLKFL